mmetsp:Transcript_7922/g.13389  ORF Transcript_7922/g.13389 Transcript_7922/m.13389 type:complete len:95 (-) Transcript_7922:502-786(-)
MIKNSRNKKYKSSLNNSPPPLKIGTISPTTLSLFLPSFMFLTIFAFHYTNDTIAIKFPTPNKHLALSQIIHHSTHSLHLNNQEEFHSPTLHSVH